MFLHNAETNVNISSLAMMGTASVWTKAYFPNAVSTGIALPTSRQIIEKRVCDVLNRLVGEDNPHVACPNVLGMSVSDRTTYFQYNNMSSLRSLSFERWPVTDAFASLGGLIASFEQTDSKRKVELFKDYESDQLSIGEIIRRLKAPSRAEGALDCAALGDVSLSNLCLFGQKIFICDFEFCHREAPGFDIGQILAELNALATVAGFNTSLYSSAIVEGYRGSGGDPSVADRWRLSFSRYYWHRYSCSHARES